MDAIVALAKKVRILTRQLRKLQITGFQRPTWLMTPLTSVAWDGDSYSTTAKTLIDLSAVFGAPANIKSVMICVTINDSASAGGDYWLILGPTNGVGSGVPIDCSGLANDRTERNQVIVPCDANGDIYYQIAASGASTMDVIMQIYGYWL